MHLASEKTSSLAFHHREENNPARDGGEENEERRVSPTKRDKSVLEYYASEPTHARQQPKGQFEVTSKSTVITLEDEKILEEHGLGSKYLGLGNDQKIVVRVERTIASNIFRKSVLMNEHF